MNEAKLNTWFEEELKKLDISPTNYKKAVDRYTSVGNMIEKKLKEKHNINCHVYVQGSFMIGTVIKPYGRDKEYDVDLVCECDLVKERITAEQLKMMIGQIIKEDGIYGKMLSKDEGRRTWTIEYAEDNELSFHIDIQPSIPNLDSQYEYAILTTTKSKKSPYYYKWDNGNALGFKEWFNQINNNSYLAVVEAQKYNILKYGIYSQVDEIPSQLIITKLQRLIQILKRHRDIRFENSNLKDDKPNSMIITILAAKVYEDIDCHESLQTILKMFCDRLKENILLFGKTTDDINGLLIDRVKGKYIIKNPRVEENLAERWNEADNNKKQAFFKWIEWISMDFNQLFKGDGTLIYENKSFDDFVLERINNNESQVILNNNESKKIINTPKPWKANV